MTIETITLPGVNNARDLGCYRAGDRQIKKGVLLRTGELINATPEAIDILRNDYHIQKILDLRDSERIKGFPDPEIEGADNIELRVMEMEDFIGMLGDPDIEEKYKARVYDKETAFEIACEYGLLGPKMYGLFVLGQKGINAYREFFRILLEHDPDKGAVLWHCKDGKDRTGVAAALILAALGADKETIYEDYLYTNINNASILEPLKKEYESRGLPENKLNIMLFASGGVFKEYLDFALDSIEKNYGSIIDYIKTELGFTDSDISLLKEKYTE